VFVMAAVAMVGRLVVAWQLAAVALGISPVVEQLTVAAVPGHTTYRSAQRCAALAE
jgi:hypothetical protein